MAYNPGTGLPGGKWYLLAAGLIFILMTAYLTNKVITLHKPRGLPDDPNFTNNAEGKKVLITDTVYATMMTQQSDKDDPAFTPMSLFYKGLRRKWATYAVFVMAMKVLMTFVASYYRATPIIQAVLTTVAAITWLSLSRTATPFLEKHCDIEDAAAKVSQILTAILAIVAAMGTCGNGAADAWVGIVVQITTALMFIGFARAIMIQQPWYVQKQKDAQGRLLFSDYDPASHHTDLRNQHKAPFIYDIQREKLTRVFHPFLDTLFEELVGGKPGDDAGTVADAAVAEEDEENQGDAGEMGLQAMGAVKDMKLGSDKVDKDDKSVSKRWKHIKFQVR